MKSSEAFHCKKQSMVQKWLWKARTFIYGRREAEFLWREGKEEVGTR